MHGASGAHGAAARPAQIRDLLPGAAIEVAPTPFLPVDLRALSLRATVR